MTKLAPVSVHSKYRMKERLGVYHKSEALSMYNKALRYGKSPSDFKGEFKAYLVNKMNKTKGSQIKVYSRAIFIYKNKRLITVLKVPDKFDANFKLDESIYEKNNDDRSLKNKDLRENFINKVHELYSCCLANSFGISEYNQDNVEYLSQITNELKNDCKMLKLRIVGQEINVLEYNDESSITDIEYEVNQFELITPNLKGFGNKFNSKGELTQFVCIVERIYSIILYIEKNNFLFKEVQYEGKRNINN